MVDSILDQSFGSRIRRLRLHRRWSQQELAYRSGISTPHISSIERDQRHPSLEYALRLANALGAPIETLCDGSAALYPPIMKSSTDELPLYLQNFVLNESSTPYLQAAHRMSTLPREDREFIAMMIELVSQKRKEPVT